MAENINRAVYQLTLDTKTTIKSKSIVGTQVGESIALDITLTENDGLNPRNLTNCEIDFACLLYNELGEAIFYKQNFDETEDDVLLASITSITEGKCLIKLRKNFAYTIAAGLAEIHIRNTVTNELTISNRFMIKISESYTNNIPSDLLDGVITLKQLEDLMNDYRNLVEDVDALKNSGQINHVHVNYTILNKLSERNGELFYNGIQIRPDVPIGGGSGGSGGIGDVTTEFLEKNYFTRTEVSNLLLNKVDAVTGKGLSTNDFTNAYKTKVDSFAPYDDSAVKQQILQLNSSKAEAVHTHTGYSLVNHNHNDVYSNLTHNHDTRYSDISHNHNTLYQTKLLDSQINNINSVTQLKTEVSNLVSVVGDSNTGILYELETKQDKLTSEQIADINRIDTIENKVSQNESRINTSEGNITNINSNITTINANLNNKVDKVVGKGLSTNDFTNADSQKLNSLENYVLPTASNTVKGGVKIGSGLSVNGDVLYVTGGGVADSVAWANVTGKPTAFTPTAHGHNDIYYTKELTDAKIGELSMLSTTDKDNLVDAINELFQLVSNGKILIASAITDMGIGTLATETFEQMANKIRQLGTIVGSIPVTTKDGSTMVSKSGDIIIFK